MANTRTKRGGERVLESRHLIGLFLGVVLLCCVFFTLGYVMGRTQYANSAVHAASVAQESIPGVAPQAGPSAASPTVTPSPEWDFYSPNKPADHLEKPAPQRVSPASTSTESALGPSPAKNILSRSRPLSRFRVPRIPRGAIVLQVAALTHESDAMGMADALQQKKFPAFVIMPATDSFYRVQVGPFATEQKAEAIKHALEREGFKAILKR